MTEFWTVIGGVVALITLIGSAYTFILRRGINIAKLEIANESRKLKFEKIYAPAFSLFLTRHITTHHRSASSFRQRFVIAKEVLYEEGVFEAILAFFYNRGLVKFGEVEFGGWFPLKEITELVDNNSQYADSKLVVLISAANRAKYEESVDDAFLTNADIKLYHHIFRQHMKLSRELSNVQ